MSTEDPFVGLLPGSNDAVTAGCTCPVATNEFGAGVSDGEGHTTFTMVESCPIHGPGIKRRNPAATKILDDALGEDRNG